MMKNIFIHKVAGQKKDAVRVNNEADIPPAGQYHCKR